MKNKRAVLLVTFGTSVQSAVPAFNNLEQVVKDTFPGVEVCWAYTAKSIRDILAERDGKLIDDPVTALKRLWADGYEKVVVQSVHVIPGREYNDLLNDLNSLLVPQSTEEGIALGKPLLYHHEDYIAAAEAIAAQLPVDTAADAVVLMGHGSEHHPADAAYGKLNDVLRHKYKNVFLGTVEGYPTLDEIVEDLASSGVKNVTLMPFMNVAGDHALNDLYGDGDDSWKTRLNRLGYKTNGYIKGLLENRGFVKIYLKHLAAAMSQIDEENGCINVL